LLPFCILYYHPVIIKLSFSLSCYPSIIRRYLVSPSITIYYHSVLAELKMGFYEDGGLHKTFFVLII